MRKGLGLGKGSRRLVCLRGKSHSLLPPPIAVEFGVMWKPIRFRPYPLFNLPKTPFASIFFLLYLPHGALVGSKQSCSWYYKKIPHGHITIQPLHTDAATNGDVFPDAPISQRAPEFMGRDRVPGRENIFIHFRTCVFYLEV